MRVTKDKVIKTASDIADEKGLYQITLKLVAEALGIRSPSLYNHVGSLEDLLREVAHNGMREMNLRMEQAAVEESAEAAIKSASLEYFNFMLVHPGVYETIQWAVWHGNEETMEIFGYYRSFMAGLIRRCGYGEEFICEILYLLLGAIHGYSTMQLGNALHNLEGTQAGLSNGIDTVLIGIRHKYGQDLGKGM